MLLMGKEEKRRNVGIQAIMMLNQVLGGVTREPASPLYGMTDPNVDEIRENRMAYPEIQWRSFIDL